jgi:hypothetical protein
MKRVWLVALSAVLSVATMTITTDGAMARRGGGAGVHAGSHSAHFAGGVKVSRRKTPERNRLPVDVAYSLLPVRVSMF